MNPARCQVEGEPQTEDQMIKLTGWSDLSHISRVVIVWTVGKVVIVWTVGKVMIGKGEAVLSDKTSLQCYLVHYRFHINCHGIEFWLRNRRTNLERRRVVSSSGRDHQ